MLRVQRKQENPDQGKSENKNYACKHHILLTCDPSVGCLKLLLTRSCS
jgi:hypothetical protein